MKAEPLRILSQMSCDYHGSEHKNLWKGNFEQMNERTVEVFNDFSTFISAPLSGNFVSLER